VIQQLSTGQSLMWHKPGKRYPIPVTVLATAPTLGRVVILDNESKRRNVPVEQLARK
jgi:hypothetical protein